MEAGHGAPFALLMLLVVISHAFHGANDIVPETTLTSAKQGQDSSVLQMTDISEDLQHCEVCAEQAVLKMKHGYHQCADDTTTDRASCDTETFQGHANKGETQFKRAVGDAKQLTPADRHDEIDQVGANCLAQLTVLKDDHQECANDSAKCSKSSFDDGVEQLKNHCDLRHYLSTDPDSESSVLLQKRARGGPGGESPQQSQEHGTSLSRADLMQMQSQELSTSLAGKRSCG